ncbi:MAG TPA: substrate-binding domain-containing protein [Candidatus Mediterraneibacter guildfordensis]|nr:substrate-binding domain-containing protein [Candidatus Mediterraneibacter guildfordensis]
MAKKGLLYILTAALMMGALTGCKQNVGTPEDNAVVEEPEENDDVQTNRLFGFSGADLSDPFCEVIKDSVSVSLEEQGDRILVRDAAKDAGTQAEQIREMIDAGAEAVFLIPADPVEITPALESLKEAEIPVINLDIRVQDTGLTDAYIGADNYSAGAYCAEDLIRRMPDGGTVGIIECTGNSSVAERINGFEESIQNAGFEIKGRINTAPDDEAGLKRELLSMFDDEQSPDALMCGDDRMALIVMEALRTSGRSDIIVYSVGGSPAVKSALKETDSALAGIGALSPINMGKTAVKTASALLADGAYEPEIYVETFFIDRENIDMYGTDGWQ